MIQKNRGHNSPQELAFQEHVTSARIIKKAIREIGVSMGLDGDCYADHRRCGTLSQEHHIWTITAAMPGRVYGAAPDLCRKMIRAFVLSATVSELAPDDSDNDSANDHDDPNETLPAMERARQRAIAERKQRRRKGGRR